MSSTRARIAALLGLSLLVVGISIVLFLGSADGCMTGSSNASCPTLAEVNGVRYSFSVGLALLDIEDDLTAFGQISRTNVPDYFSETTVYSVTGIDPKVLLIGRAAPMQSDEGPYRLLSVFGGDHTSIWPAFCQYLTELRRYSQPGCGRERPIPPP